MGAYARLIGFAIALAYFGICKSRIGGGQTLGKRWLDVRVVDAHDQLLSLPRSLLGYAVLGIRAAVAALVACQTLIAHRGSHPRCTSCVA
jgi:uncharacterized RDD family membrane protein YckC